MANNSVYSPEKDTTFHYDDSGSLIGTSPGKEISLHDLGSKMGERPNLNKIVNSIVGTMADGPVIGGSPAYEDSRLGSPVGMPNYKDTLTDIASQLPLMIPGAGKLRMAGKVAGSLGLGTVVDQLLNEDKSVTSSLGDATMNTGLGLIPWFMENKFKVPLPGIKANRKTVINREPTVMERAASSNRITKLEGEGSVAGTNVRDSIHKAAEFVGPHTDSMTNLEQEIQNLISRRDNPDFKWTDKNITGFNNAIDKNRAALDALNEANTASGFVTHSEGSNAGTSKRSATTVSKGDTTSEGTTTPGKTTIDATSLTTGHSLFERMLEMIKDSHVTQKKQLSLVEKMLWGLGPNIAVDSTFNQQDKGK